MMRLPAKLSLFVVPAVCLLLLGAAWVLMREGGESEVTEGPALRLLCEESLTTPVTDIAAAYVRRTGMTVETEFVSSSGLAGRLAGEPGFHLVLLAGGDGIADELIGKGLVVATESAAESGAVRGLFVNRVVESTDLAPNFVQFLAGPFAREILERHRSAARGPGL